ncbi:MAG: nucleoside deaminase [Vicinamibacterales bacterium]
MVPLLDLPHAFYMSRCRDLARQARASGDAAVGAVVVQAGSIIAEGVESVLATFDVSAHAEVVALRRAGRTLATTRLRDCVLYTSVAPCVMCAYAIRLAALGGMVTPAPDPASEDARRGWLVLTSPRVLRRRSPPVVVRYVHEDAGLP